MTDHAQRARAAGILRAVVVAQQWIAGGYDDDQPNDPVDIIAAALEQAAQPVWVNKAPGVTGWFFHRETSESPYRPIEIVMANYTGALQPWVIDGSERRPLACVVLEGGEWAGPLSVPIERG